MALETAALANINLKVDQMSTDQVLMRKFKPKTEGLQKIIANQTARLNTAKTELSDSDKNKGGKVYLNWLTSNSIVEGAVTSNCTLTGADLDAAAVAYDLTMEFKTDFTVTEDDFKNSIYSREELVAHGFLKALQVMDEAYAKRAIAKADAYAGTNLYLATGYTQTGAKTTVPAASYGSKMLAYIARMAEMNRLNNYYILDGGELFDEAFLANINSGNAEGKGLAALYNNFDIAFDMINFAKAGVATDTLVVDADSLAFVTRNRFQSLVPVAAVGQKRYKIKSPSLAGVFYDVYYQEVCAPINGGTHDVVQETFRLQTEGDLIKAPEDGFAGVIALQKGA